MPACKEISFLQPTWNPLLVKATQPGSNTLDLLSEAIHISAHFHPLFHFFESALNTELACIYAKQSNRIQAKALATRALFLEHDNEAAAHILDGLPIAEIPIYNKATNTQQGWLPIGLQAAALTNETIFTLAANAREQAQQGDEAAAIQSYQRAIAQTEQAHQAYHKAAAKPWILRAEYFTALGEHALAKNDLIKARDLDPAI